VSFDWREYVSLAHQLAQKVAPSTSDEACLRAAISRGYYGSHCSARALLVARREATLKGTGEDHFIVIRAFKRHRSDKRRRLGVQLERLYLDRCLADYENEIPGLEKRAAAALALADEILRAIPFL
jgi:hypothetical protein